MALTCAARGAARITLSDIDRQRVEQVAAEIARRTGKETRTVVLGHLQRGGRPVAYDRLPGYLGAVTVLEPRGNLVADVLAAVAALGYNEHRSAIPPLVRHGRPP